MAYVVAIAQLFIYINNTPKHSLVLSNSFPHWPDLRYKLTKIFNKYCYLNVCAYVRYLLHRNKVEVDMGSPGCWLAFFRTYRYENLRYARGIGNGPACTVHGQVSPLSFLCDDVRRKERKKYDLIVTQVIIWLPSGITDNTKKKGHWFCVSVCVCVPHSGFHQGHPERSTEGGDGRHELKVSLNKINYGGCVEQQTPKKEKRENDRNHWEKKTTRRLRTDTITMYYVCAQSPATRSKLKILLAS